MYNLILRIADQCSIDPQNINKSINNKYLNLRTTDGCLTSKLSPLKINNIEQLPAGTSPNKNLELNHGNENSQDLITSCNVLTEYNLTNVDNLLTAIMPKNDNPMTRFNLIGGIEGVCRAMAFHNVVPETKTLDFMLKVIELFKSVNIYE